MGKAQTDQNGTVYVISELANVLGLFNCGCGSEQRTYLLTLTTGNEVAACDACEKFVICENCDGFELEANVTEFNDHALCVGCVKELSAVCEKCDERKVKSDVETVETNDGLWTLCESCRDELTYCDRCEVYTDSDCTEVRTSDSYRNRTEVWCEDCVDSYAFSCEGCGGTFSENHVDSTTINGETYCDNCASENFTSCDNCGTYCDSDEAVYDEDREVYNCEGCAERLGRNWRNGLSYGNDAVAEFGFLTAPGEDAERDYTLSRLRYLGVELELEMTGDDGREAMDVARERFANFAVFKSDGSLEDGMELNTPPATFARHKAFNWKGALRAMEYAGWGAERTCGLHVHVNKNSFVENGVQRLAQFIYNPDNLEALYSIAGRRENSYCRLDGIEWDKAARGSNGRYVALNCDTGKGTVEFRLFAATTSGNELLTRLEFVQSVCEYADSQTELDRLEFNGFCDYLAENAERFPNLFEFCGDVQADYNATAIDRAERAQLEADARRIEAERQAERTRRAQELAEVIERERVRQQQQNAQELIRRASPEYVNALNWRECLELAGQMRRVIGNMGTCACSNCSVGLMVDSGLWETDYSRNIYGDESQVYGSRESDMIAARQWVRQLTEQLRTMIRPDTPLVLPVRSANLRGTTGTGENAF